MCGIAGYYSSNKNFLNELKLKKAIKSIKYRGPDNLQLSFFEDLKVGLASCRLRVIDLRKDADMPMYDTSENFCIVYNGEIYNFLELKLNHNLITKTNSDTEVILEMYKKFGENCLKYFIGIFSFAIFDLKKKEIFAARDRLGVKPFYYYCDNNIFIFASEIIALNNFLGNKSENTEVIDEYLYSSFYDHSNKTFYKNIFSLEPGHYIIKDNIGFKKIKYWYLKKNITNLSHKESINIFFHKLEASIKKQLHADTKIAVNLSGGLDSLILAEYINKINNGQGDIKAFNYCFENFIDPAESSLSYFCEKNNWKVEKLMITPKMFLDNINDVVISQYEPMPGLITLAKHMILKKNSDKNYKVVLEGQGGDDFLGGYKYHQPYHIKDLINNKFFSKAIKEIYFFCKKENISIIKYLKFYFLSINSFYSGGVSADGSFIKSNFLNKKLFKFEECELLESFYDRIILRDMRYTKLPRILRSCDRASMCSSKELRVPFLDHELVEHAFNMKADTKVHNGNLRYFFRNYANEQFNNPRIFDKKSYVSDPQTSWLKTSLFDWAYNIIEQGKNNFSTFKSVDILKDFYKFKKSNSKNSFNFWKVINLSLWYKLCLKNS